MACNIHFQGRNGHIGSLTRSFKAPVLKAGSQQKAQDPLQQHELREIFRLDEFFSTETVAGQGSNVHQLTTHGTVACATGFLDNRKAARPQRLDQSCKVE